jgi:DNA repair protein SbcD/Mre11
VKLLHTADWHVGKTVKGQSRLEEHRAVLGDIVRIADSERTDLVLVAGDVYETAAPNPDAEALVLQTLLDLRETGAKVVVIGGNHDNPHRFEAVRPLFAALGVTVMGMPRRPEDGGVIELECAGGDSARIAMLPFCSQRSVIRTAQLMELDAGQLAGAYDERMRQVIAHLTRGFTDDAVNIVTAHGMVTGAALGGGERSAQTYMDYWIGAAAFPAHAHYVALGHVHRTQQVGGAAPIWYSGSPIQVDFGDRDQQTVVLLVEATPSTPAQLREVAVTGGRNLRTVRGDLEQLRELVGSTGDDFLRVVVEEHKRVGLAEEVREMLGAGVVEVRIETPDAATGGERREARLVGKTPNELFAAYLEEQGIADDRLGQLFAELLDEATV